VRKLRQEIYSMCRDYGLYYLWALQIESIVFYNEPLSPSIDDAYDICHLADLRMEADQPSIRTDILDFDNLLFPLAIRISPFASQRDILDYVRKNAPMIKREQERYLNESGKIRIGKVKKRKEKIRGRNDFIYENRHLPHREIMQLVMEKFGDSSDTPDQGHIGKIISLEKKRRKEV